MTHSHGCWHDCDRRLVGNAFRSIWPSSPVLHRTRSSLSIIRVIPHEKQPFDNIIWRTWYDYQLSRREPGPSEPSLVTVRLTSFLIVCRRGTSRPKIRRERRRPKRSGGKKSRKRHHRTKSSARIEKQREFCFLHEQLSTSFAIVSCLLCWPCCLFRCILWLSIFFTKATSVSLEERTGHCTHQSSILSFYPSAAAFELINRLAPYLATLSTPSCFQGLETSRSLPRHTLVTSDSLQNWCNSLPSPVTVSRSFPWVLLKSNRAAVASS